MTQIFRFNPSDEVPAMGGTWVPTRDTPPDGYKPWFSSPICFNPSGHISYACKELLGSIWYNSGVGIVQPYKILGSFSISRNRPPLFSKGLRDAIDAIAPDCFEYIPIENLWCYHESVPIPGGPYYLANLRSWKMTWDRRKTKIVERIDAGGNYSPVPFGEKFVDPAAAVGSPIWRAETDEVFCTQVFIDAFEAVAPGVLFFYPVKMSEYSPRH